MPAEPPAEPRLDAGSRTTWRVHETLRKVFQVDVPNAEVGGAAD